jgi:hypothetical protein
MKLWKNISNTLASVGKTIENSAELINVLVGDEGLKHSTKQSFKLVNISLDESVEMALLESEENIKQFRKEHGIGQPGRPKKS